MRVQLKLQALHRLDWIAVIVQRDFCCVLDLHAGTPLLISSKAVVMGKQRPTEPDSDRALGLIPFKSSSPHVQNLTTRVT